MNPIKSLLKNIFVFLVKMKTTLSATERERYSQQILMPELGERGQQKLKRSKVLIVGLGGLGTPVAEYLARAGVGTIGLVENDVVQRSNLHRQIFYCEEDLGAEKIIVAEREIRKIFPEVNVELYKTFLTEKNALEIIPGYDIIVDATDNFTSRYLINDACYFAEKPLVFASVFRYSGQLTLFDRRSGPCYRCLYSEPPSEEFNCSEAGVMGSVAGIMGAIAATEVMKYIIDRGQLLMGRLLTFEALGMRWSEIEFEKNPACSLCGATPTIHSLKSIHNEFYSPHSSRTMPTTDITVEELKHRLDLGEKPFLLDVREQSEYNVCNLGGKLIPLATLPGHLDDLNPNEEIIVHCKMGGRSAQAAQYLRSKGFENVRNLTGGIMAWAEKIDLTMKKY